MNFLFLTFLLVFVSNRGRIVHADFREKVLIFLRQLLRNFIISSITTTATIRGTFPFHRAIAGGMPAVAANRARHASFKSNQFIVFVFWTVHAAVTHPAANQAILRSILKCAVNHRQLFQLRSFMVIIPFVDGR